MFARCPSLIAHPSPVTLPAMDFTARQNKLRDHLATTRFDALLISHLPNIRYLCGFTGSAGLLLVEHTGSVFLSDVRYDTQAHEEVKGAKVVIARAAALAALADLLSKRRKRAKGWAIGIEAEHFTVSEKKRLAVPEEHVDLRPQQNERSHRDGTPAPPDRGLTGRR